MWRTAVVGLVADKRLQTRDIWGALAVGGHGRVSEALQTAAAAQTAALGTLALAKELHELSRTAVPSEAYLGRLLAATQIATDCAAQPRFRVELLQRGCVNSIVRRVLLFFRGSPCLSLVSRISTPAPCSEHVLIIYDSLFTFTTELFTTAWTFPPLRRARAAFFATKKHFTPDARRCLEVAVSHEEAAASTMRLLCTLCPEPLGSSKSPAHVCLPPQQCAIQLPTVPATRMSWCESGARPLHSKVHLRAHASELRGCVVGDGRGVACGLEGGAVEVASRKKAQRESEADDSSNHIIKSMTIARGKKQATTRARRADTTTTRLPYRAWGCSIALHW